jgi:hypothetical protein
LAHTIFGRQSTFDATIVSKSPEFDILFIINYMSHLLVPFYFLIPKVLLKMESVPYPLFPIGHFLHLGIFAPYMQPLDSKLTKISVFYENFVLSLFQRRSYSPKKK